MEYLKIGVIANTHGLQGELKIKPSTDDIDLYFEVGDIFYIQYNKEMIEVEIKKSSYHKGMIYVKLAGYHHINDVEKFKGSYCMVSIDDLQELEDNEAYYYELIDSEVYSEDEKYLGKVSEILESSAHEILRVVNDDHMFLVPYVDAFIIDFIRDEKKLIIRLMEGLYEN